VRPFASTSCINGTGLFSSSLPLPFSLTDAIRPFESKDKTEWTFVSEKSAAAKTGHAKNKAKEVIVFWVTPILQ
jgi:hypothetical protein